MRRRRPKAGRGIRPNVGIQKAYQAKLDKMIDEMHNSISYWIGAAYKANSPVIAQDALPAAELEAAIKKLVKRWKRKFNRAALDLADYFATAVSERSDAVLKKILKDGGISVPFTMTRGMQDIFRATVNANVSLIKSIPEKYLGSVEQLVMESVQRGRDLGSLSSSLQNQFGVTKRRAALISRDQNNKATSAFTQARRTELDLNDAIWVHSHAGKEPRPTHVDMDGKKFDIRKGMWDPAEKKWIQPGELINCRCFSRPIIAGFS